MKKKKVYSVGVFASIALFFGIIGLLLSFLPLRMFALIPAGIAIYFALVAYILTRVFKTKKTYVYVVFGISVLSIAIASITESVTTNVVVEDKAFEEQLETRSEEVDSALLEAFEEDIFEEEPAVATDSSTKPEPVEEIEEEFVEETIEDIEF